MKTNEYLQQLAKLIKKQRVLQGVTQEELSFKCSIHRNEISLIERGHKDIKLSTLLKLLHCLDIPGEDIIALKNTILMGQVNN